MSDTPRTDAIYFDAIKNCSADEACHVFRKQAETLERELNEAKRIAAQDLRTIENFAHEINKLRLDETRLDELLPCYVMKKDGAEWQFYGSRDDIDKSMEGEY